ncbi:hypothetical protein MN116_007628 [Schistosoma mekongi]|uniref:Uncharacterized protein n=1 Tax=Schistosoma mekongi TaxID=38744 RepID=A0AAE1Z795_SCHME|nr:hypothetical protein MN116_007628 [Schistosoma mekongi]
MANPLYEVLESYESENVKKASVRASVWIGYRDECMIFDEILEQAGDFFAEHFGSKDCNKYPTVVEIKPSGGPACESLFTLYRRLSDNQFNVKSCNDSTHIFKTEWPNFPVYIRRFHLKSVTQDEFIDETMHFIEDLSKMNLNFIPEPYYWVIYDPSLMANEDGNAEIWVKLN